MSALSRCLRKMSQTMMNDGTPSELTPASAAAVPVNAQVGQVQQIQPGPVQNLTELSTTPPVPQSSPVNTSLGGGTGGSMGEYSQEGADADMAKVGQANVGGYRSDGVFRNDSEQHNPQTVRHEKPEKGLMRSSKTAQALQRTLKRRQPPMRQASGTAQLAAPKVKTAALLNRILARRSRR